MRALGRFADQGFSLLHARRLAKKSEPGADLGDAEPKHGPGIAHVDRLAAGHIRSASCACYLEGADLRETSRPRYSANAVYEASGRCLIIGAG